MIELTKRLCTTDSEVEDFLPVIEFILNTTPQTKLAYSPFQICFGQKPMLCELEELKPSVAFSGNYELYLKTLRTELNSIHRQVYQDKLNMKEEETKAYNKQYKVIPATWQVGDMVLIEDNRPRPHSDVIISHKPYNGPHLIKEVIQGDPKIGKAYRVVNVKTGQLYPYVVNTDRLKKYDPGRVSLEARLNRPHEGQNEQKRTVDGEQTVTTEKQKNRNKLEPAVKILKERVQSGKREFLVLFVNGQSYWCDVVTNALLTEWRLRKKQRRKKGRQ